MLTCQSSPVATENFRLVLFWTRRSPSLSTRWPGSPWTWRAPPGPRCRSSRSAGRPRGGSGVRWVEPLLSFPQTLSTPTSWWWRLPALLVRWYPAAGGGTTWGTPPPSTAVWPPPGLQPTSPGTSTIKGSVSSPLLSSPLSSPITSKQQQRQVKPQDVKLYTDPAGEYLPADGVLQTTLGIKIKLRRYYYDVTSVPWCLIISAPRHHFQKKKRLKLKCVATIYDVYYKVNEISIERIRQVLRKYSNYTQQSYFL